MRIELTSQQEAYLRRLVKDGVYDTVEDAVDDMLFPADDDAWMKPLVDEALADIEAGRAARWDVEAVQAELKERCPEIDRGSDR